MLTARCVICESECELASVGPKEKCPGCGARGGLKVTRVEDTYVPTREIRRPTVPELARELEEALRG